MSFLHFAREVIQPKEKIPTRPRMTRLFFRFSWSAISSSVPPKINVWHNEADFYFYRKMGFLNRLRNTIGNKNGEPEDSPADDISSSPIRLSLGKLLLSSACFFFTGPLYSCRVFSPYKESIHSPFPLVSRIDLQKELAVKLTEFLSAPQVEQFRRHGIKHPGIAGTMINQSIN